MLENGIEVRDYDAVSSDISLLASGQLTGSSKAKVSGNEALEASEETSTLIANGENAGEMKHGIIWIDPSSCNLALFSKLIPNRVYMQQSPLALAKAIKVTSRF